MPAFRVICYRAGKWDEQDPHDIEAENEKDAAEKACGATLIEDASKPGRYRAKVWPVASPSKIKHFSEPL